MKVNLMVRQIFQKAEVIKQNMTETWTKLEDLEGSYQQMMLRIHRLQVIFLDTTRWLFQTAASVMHFLFNFRQSNRVCLGLLTGKDYPGESHPTDCPCSAVEAKEAEDRKRQEERRRIEAEAKRNLEEKREVERIKREQVLDMRKKRFYSKMKAESAKQKKTPVRLTDSPEDRER